MPSRCSCCSSPRNSFSYSCAAPRTAVTGAGTAAVAVPGTVLGAAVITASRAAIRTTAGAGVGAADTASGAGIGTAGTPARTSACTVAGTGPAAPRTAAAARITSCGAPGVAGPGAAAFAVAGAAVRDGAGFPGVYFCLHRLLPLPCQGAGVDGQVRVVHRLHGHKVLFQVLPQKGAAVLGDRRKVIIRAAVGSHGAGAAAPQHLRSDLCLQVDRVCGQQFSVVCHVFRLTISARRPGLLPCPPRCLPAPCPQCFPGEPSPGPPPGHGPEPPSLSGSPRSSPGR